jgi:hypothetical protein
MSTTTVQGAYDPTCDAWYWNIEDGPQPQGALIHSQELLESGLVVDRLDDGRVIGVMALPAVSRISMHAQLMANGVSPDEVDAMINEMATHYLGSLPSGITAQVGDTVRMYGGPLGEIVGHVPANPTEFTVRFHYPDATTEDLVISGYNLAVLSKRTSTQTLVAVPVGG